MRFLLEKMKDIAAYAVIGMALYGAYAAYQHGFKSQVSEAYESYATGVSEDASLVTGYAYVGLLWFLPGSDDRTVEDWYVAPPREFPKATPELDPSRLRGVCYRLYRVAFGYPVLKTALDAFGKGAAADPESVASRILAVETIETRAAKDFTEYRCDRFDTDVVNRSSGIERRLVLDDQLRPQLESGCRILAAYAATAKHGATPEACNDRIRVRMTAISERVDCHIRNTLANTPNAPCLSPVLRAERPAALQARSESLLFDKNLGYLASLKVTLSTVGIITAESGWWFVKFEQFYVRRDLTEAVYGSEIRDLRMRENANPPTLSVVAGQPDLISRNRFITIAVKSGSFSLPQELRQTSDRRGYVEAKMLDSIDGALDEISGPARRLAAQHLRAHLEQLAQARSARLALKFE